MIESEVINKLNKHNVLGRDNWEWWHFSGADVYSYGGNRADGHGASLKISIDQAKDEIKRMEQEVEDRPEQEKVTTAVFTPMLDWFFKYATALLEHADAFRYSDERPSVCQPTNGELRKMVEEWQQVGRILDRGSHGS